MSDIYKKSFHVRWGDMDFNAHMRNTAYLDLAGDVRMMYFQEHGFSMREFERLQIGPVILRDELDYFRELRLLETVEVNLTIAGLREDASRVRFRNEFYRTDGKLCARVTSLAGWLDLSKRKLTIPPDELRNAIETIAKSADFELFL